MDLFSLSGDIGETAHKLTRPDSIRTTSGPDYLAFESSPATVLPEQPFEQPPEAWVPLLLLADKNQTWESIAREEFASISAALTPDPSLEAKAREIAGNLDSPLEKVRALAGFVQKSVRYKAVEFGIRGTVPERPEKTLRQGYGDCKDQSVLFCQLARACGIEAHPALMNSEWETPLEPPARGHFNHMVAYVPALGGIVDTTDPTLPDAEACPYGLWNRPILVLDPANPSIKTTQSAKDTGIDFASKRTVSLLPPDGLRIEEELVLGGYYAGRMRVRLARQEPKTRFQYIQDRLAENGNFRLETCEMPDLAERYKPAVFRMVYSLPNAFTRSGKSTTMRIPAAWESDYLRLPFLAERLSPFRWNIPFRMTSEVTLAPSLGTNPESLARWTAGESNPFGALKITPGAPIRFEFSVRSDDYPASDYTRFHQFWSDGRAAWSREIEVNPFRK